MRERPLEHAGATVLDSPLQSGHLRSQHACHHIRHVARAGIEKLEDQVGVGAQKHRRLEQRAARGQVDERDGLAVLQARGNRILKFDRGQPRMHAPVCAAPRGAIGCRHGVEQRGAWRREGQRCRSRFAHGDPRDEANVLPRRAPSNDRDFLPVEGSDVRLSDTGGATIVQDETRNDRRTMSVPDSGEVPGGTEMTRKRTAGRPVLLGRCRRSACA